MHKRGSIQWIAMIMNLALACLILTIPASVVPVWAAGLPTVTVTIPVEHLTRGDELNRAATFVLAARDEGTPMPEGSVDGRKAVTVFGGGTADFGEIRYDYPDVYYYTVSREPAGMAGLTEDDAVYEIMVAAFNDGSAKLVIQEEGADGKAERIVYEDVYHAPAAERQIPATGDGTGFPWRYAVLFALAAAMLVVLRKGKKDETKEVSRGDGGTGTDDYIGRHYRGGGGDDGRRTGSGGGRRDDAGGAGDWVGDGRSWDDGGREWTGDGRNRAGDGRGRRNDGGRCPDDGGSAWGRGAVSGAGCGRDAGRAGRSSRRDSVGTSRDGGSALRG